jgi:dTDP-4-amino-4,6-dideoxy-D-glucose ammonia-lyase
MHAKSGSKTWSICDMIDGIQKWLYNDYTDKLPNELIRLFEDSHIPKRWFNHAALIVHRLSEMPWYTQRKLAEETSLSIAELFTLNSFIRESSELQNIILHEGLGRKYWNTMIPYVKSGKIDKVINYQYDFPMRLALFPGMSCMYYCGFCGRNQSAAYEPKEVLKSGADRYKKIISDLPKNSTISISGGLEPLTNFKLGEIISHAKSLGHRVPLITNAHMLTPAYLKKQPGIWDLDSLRVSLYGTDEESTYFVTRHKKAYKLVKNNIIEFLNERNRRGSDIKVGLNYIIIPEIIDTIIPLLDYIIDINKKVKGQGIDFLTIREDFGSVTEITDSVDKDVQGRKYHLDGFLSDEQREQLIDIFEIFNKRREKECSDLHVDFGYAMVALGDGVLGKPLARVDGTQMRKSGFSQLSVAVDSAGDVFLYREAGFLDRPGNDKFIAGRIGDDESLESVLKDFVNSKHVADLKVDDSRFMDSYDHLITLLVNQAEDDLHFKIPFNLGPVKVRVSNPNDLNVNLSNNWYRDEKN